jgi:hypothetical protein
VRASRAFPAWLLGAILAAGLSACGNEAPERAAQEPALEIEVPESAIGDPAVFNADFARSFRQSCTTAATDAGTPPAMAKTVCDCGVSELDRQFSAIEKARLTTDQLEAVMQLCAKKVLKTDG